MTIAMDVTGNVQQRRWTDQPGRHATARRRLPGPLRAMAWACWPPLCEAFPTRHFFPAARQIFPLKYLKKIKKRAPASFPWSVEAAKSRVVRLSASRPGGGL